MTLLALQIPRQKRYLQVSSRHHGEVRVVAGRIREGVGLKKKVVVCLRGKVGGRNPRCWNKYVQIHAWHVPRDRLRQSVAAGFPTFSVRHYPDRARKAMVDDRSHTACVAYTRTGETVPEPNDERGGPEADLEETAKGAAKQYHDAIRQQKKKHWDEFLADNDNIWAQRSI